MGLIHWWPLNGDTKDYGLNPIDLANSGMTLKDIGKIGKCYRSDSSSKMTATDNSLSGMRKISVAIWIKCDNVPSSQFLDIWHIGTFRAELYKETTNASYPNVWNGYSDSKFSWFVPRLETGKWEHLVFVLDVDAGEYMAYRNGAPVSQTPCRFTDDGTTYVGTSIQINDTNLTGVSYNDFRIYDHCLSKKEIKELSKGLVLHYDFEDGEIEETTNILAGKALGFGSRWETVTTYPVGYIAQARVLKRLTADPYFGTASTFLSNTDNPASWAGKYLTLSCWYYRASSTDPKISVGLFGNNGSTTYSGCSNVISTTDLNVVGKWAKAIIVLQVKPDMSAYTSITYIYGCSGGNASDTLYMADPQIEIKDHATPFVNGSRSTGKVYDNSGYGYDGSATNDYAPTILSTSASGQHYAKFNGNANTKVFNASFPQFTKNLTFNVWCYQESASSPQSAQYIVSQGRDSTASGFNIISSSGTACVQGVFGSVSSGTNIVGGWHMITGTYDGSMVKVYVDGVLKNSLSYTSDLTYTYAPAFVVGKMAYGYTNTTTYFMFNGRIADVKVYSTALSADDVKAEYNRKAAIDRNGNLFTGEIIEDPDTEELIFGTYIGEGGYYVRNGSASNLYNDEDGNMVIRDHTWVASPWFKVNAEETLQFDAIIIGDENSTSIRNQIYIGFEHYDDDGNTGENELCDYYMVWNPESYQERVTKTVNTEGLRSTTTAGTKAYKWRVRILNAWASSTDSNNSLRVLKIRHLTLRRIPSYKQNINKNNTVLANTVHENPYTDKTSMYKNGVLRTAGIREL